MDVTRLLLEDRLQLSLLFLYIHRIMSFRILKIRNIYHLQYYFKSCRFAQSVQLCFVFFSATNSYTFPLEH